MESLLLQPASSPLLRDFGEHCSLILSVDDEPSVLYTRYKILQASAYNVLNAVDGEQALQLFASFPVDLVLLDYVMPGIDGTVVAREMKRVKRNVPVILVSAFVPKEIHALADDIVEKGNGPLPLLEAIRGHLAYPARQQESCIQP